MRLRTALLVSLAALFPVGIAQAQQLAPTDFTTVQLPGADDHTEPRITVDHNDDIWTVTNGWSSDVYVYGSKDHGQTFTKAASTWTQVAPTIDTDIVSMDLGQDQPRLFASELDTGGLNFPSGYSDDGGKTWHDSQGSIKLADQDRQWFAVGPKDPITGKPRVYLLYHNLGSGLVTHNMWVATSLDGGETFGPPVPITAPGSDAWTDLQCADSGGPSNITVNPKTGQIYAFFTTRAADVQGVDAGGCGSSALQPPLEFNIVNGTRVWVATSPNGLPGTWQDTIAVDDSKTGQVVSQQLAYGALDTHGGVYVAYPESPKPYPDLTGSAVKLVWQDPDASGNLDPTKWSKPVTLVKPGMADDGTTPQNGADLVHLAVGDPGKVDVAYFQAQDGGPNNKPVPDWYAHVVQSLDVRSVDPHVTNVDVSAGIPSYHWTASQMMGICAAAGPTQGVQNGLTCDRSTDVWGIALDKECRLTIAFPTGQGGAAKPDNGTYVATQQSGPALCSSNPQIQ
jgi:hypothetical protein